MSSKQDKLKLNELMNNVQIATMSDTDITDDDYVLDVVKRTNEVEKAIGILKKEIIKQGLIL